MCRVSKTGNNTPIQFPLIVTVMTNSSHAIVEKLFRATACLEACNTLTPCLLKTGWKPRTVNALGAEIPTFVV